VSHYNLHLKRPTDLMSTPPTKPKRSTFSAPTAGLTTGPAWTSDDWARYAEHGTAHRFFCTCGEYSPCAESALKVECKHCGYEYARDSVDDDWFRDDARAKGESEVRREGLDHGGVVLVGDVWESKDTPCSKAGQYRYRVSAVDGDHFHARNTVLDLAVDGDFADMFALCTLISRAAKPERKPELCVGDQVLIETGACSGQSGSVTSAKTDEYGRVEVKIFGGHFWRLDPDSLKIVKAAP
jgi:hypothetical protein